MKRFLLCAALLVACSLAQCPATAAVELFLKLDGITGDSTDKAHPSWIDILSYDFGITNSSSIGSATGGAGAGKVSFSDLSITKNVDKSSTSLLLDAASGKLIKDGLLDVVKVTGQKATPFLEYKFTDLLVSSYSTGAANGDDLPTESISLNFGKIEFSEFSQTPNGSIGLPTTVGWDLKANSVLDPVPEPATFTILATGLGLLGLQLGRKRRA